MTTLRILQVSDDYAPASGGLERVVAALSQALAAEGHTVEVATLARPGSPARSFELGVTVHRVDGWIRHLPQADPAHRFHPTTADPALVRRLQEIVDRLRPQVVHAHGWILHSVLRLRLPVGCRLVTTLHDYSLVCARKTLTPDLDSTCSGPSLRKCVSCASRFYGPVKGTALSLALAAETFEKVDTFLPISRAVADACVADQPASKVRVIPSPVPDDLPVGMRPDWLPDGDFLLFVGALGPHKGVDVLAEAHRMMRRPVPLVLLGPHRPDTPQLLQVPGRPVIVRSGVAHPQIMAAYAAAAAVVVPSRWAEPQGLVAVEALAAGAPVVASRVGGLAEIVEPAGLLVPPGDASSLAMTLDALLDDPPLRRRMALAGPVRARRYTMSAVLPHVMAAYRNEASVRSTTSSAQVVNQAPDFGSPRSQEPSDCPGFLTHR
jgi:glycosyltransferase involved in cell wall biosynthesis